MAQVTFKGTPTKLSGNFPKVGDTIGNFVLAQNDLADTHLNDFKDQILVLNIFPSLDTPVCSDSVRNFNSLADDLPNAKVLCISKDLPFAQARFCGIENIANAKTLSAFRNPEFANQLGVDISEGPLQGLLARAVIVLDSTKKVLYTELVPEITHKPNYTKCLEFIQQL